MTTVTEVTLRSEGGPVLAVLLGEVSIVAGLTTTGETEPLSGVTRAVAVAFLRAVADTLEAGGDRGSIGP